GLLMFVTSGDTCASCSRSATSSRVARTFSSAGRPSSSAHQIVSAPRASAARKPRANPPAPPRFVRLGRYIGRGRRWGTLAEAAEELDADVDAVASSLAAASVV